MALVDRNAVSRTVTVYEWDQRQIENLDVRSPRDALEYMPGLYFSRTFRNEYSFVLRGFEQRQVSVFLDGVPISVPYDGLVDVSQFAGADLERVRVSQGFSSMLYGANSLGGTVNLMTRSPAADWTLGARVEGSDHGRTFGTVTFAGGTEHLRLTGSASLDRASSFRLSSDFTPTRNEDGGARNNSEYFRTRFGLKAEYIINPSHRVGVHLSGTDNEFNVPPDAVSEWVRYWRFPVWQKGLLSLNTGHLFGEKVSLRTAWYYDRYRNKLRSFDDDTYSTQTRGYAFDSEYDDYSLGVNLYPTFSALPFGLTHTVLSYKKDVHRQSDGEGPFERYSTEMLTLGIEQDVDWTPSLSMVAGMNVNYLRPLFAEGLPLRDPLHQVNGQLALQYRLAPALSSHVAVARKSRFPTLKELYSSRLGRNIPNPDLRSESSLHAEVGVDLEAGAWRGGLSVFRSDLRDLIGNVVVGEGMRQLQNINTARMQGVEVDVQHQSNRWSIGVNYALLSAVNTSDERESRHLEYRPAHRLNALVSYGLQDRIRLGSEVTYTAGQYYQNPDNGAWERLNDMLWVNLRLEYQVVRGVRGYTRVDNVFDAAYYSRHGVPLPGREMSVGMKVRL